MRQAPQTLAKAAVSGSGPRFVRSGRQVLYATADLDAWARGRMKGPFRSTSDGGAAVDRRSDHGSVAVIAPAGLSRAALEPAADRRPDE